MKRILIITAILMLGLSMQAFAAGKVLSDNAMEQVSAGDWVITEEGQQVNDVYTTNNTLWLLENSQKDINAVSNANTIDSAVAVQANIARVSGDSATENVAVNGNNAANLTNYRPSDSMATSTSTSTSVGSTEAVLMTKESGKSWSMGMDEGETISSGESGSFGSGLAYNETLDVAAAIAGSTKDIDKTGIGGSATAGALVVDYDKVISESTSGAFGKSFSKNEHKNMSAGGSESCATTFGAMSSTTQTDTMETSTSTRSSKGVNNHILLDATSQQSIRAVSNLNSVASGAAVQTNIASNVGVSGTISHVNSATVASGF
ncbi:MAG: hypothetical protein PHE58_04195 [Candidatus Omnitrophica bacterium]|nr:hypothetical protein [Candidatus Omnitrophota bacterium]